MKNLFRLFCFVFILSTSGCGWFGSPKVSDSLDSDDTNPFIESGKVIDVERLKSGGTIVIIPFKAGADIEADEELDKVSLMIVKGFSEELDESGSPLKCVFEEDASDADFLMEGSVTQLASPAKLKKWIGKRRLDLSVKGKIIDRTTGKTVAVFTDHKRSQFKKEDHKQLGLRIGEDLAKFILSGIE